MKCIKTKTWVLQSFFRVLKRSHRHKKFPFRHCCSIVFTFVSNPPSQWFPIPHLGDVFLSFLILISCPPEKLDTGVAEMWYWLSTQVSRLNLIFRTLEYIGTHTLLFSYVSKFLASAAAHLSKSARGFQQSEIGSQFRPVFVCTLVVVVTSCFIVHYLDSILLKMCLCAVVLLIFSVGHVSAQPTVVCFFFHKIPIIKYSSCVHIVQKEFLRRVGFYIGSCNLLH